MILAFMGLHLKVKCPKSIIPIQRANPCNLIFRALSSCQKYKIREKVWADRNKIKEKKFKAKITEIVNVQVMMGFCLQSDCFRG